MPRPVPIIIPGTGSMGMDMQQHHSEVNLTGLIKLLDATIGASRRRSRDIEAARALAPLVNVPEADIGTVVESPAGRQTVFDLFKTIKTPKEEKSPFALINVEKFTPESISQFQKSKDYGQLKVRDSYLRKLTGGKAKPEAEMALRKEYTQLSKTYREVRDSYQRVEASAQDPSPAGDLALVFNYMKVLDPGSVVRESEFANAQTAQEWMERKGLSFEAVARVWRGERLSDKAREDFRNRAEMLFERQQAQHDRRKKQFRGITKRQGLDVRNVMLEFEAPERRPLQSFEGRK